MNGTGGIRGFLLIWLGQLVSIIGSALTGFVLGVWTYELTGSATRFALIMLSGAVPAFLAAPIAGAVADRFNRRRVLIVADCVAASTILVLWLLVNGDALQVWHVYPITASTAVCAIFNQITFAAMMPDLVPKRHLSRANGLSQAVFAVQISAPIIAGVLLVAVGLAGITAINLVTFTVSLAIVLFVPLPVTAIKRDTCAEQRTTLRNELAGGWIELRKRPGLIGLLAVLGGFYFCFGVGGTLVRPLVLSFASPIELGLQVFTGGCGLLLGSVAMGIWGGPRNRMRGIAMFMALGGVALALHSPAPSIWLLCAVGPMFLFVLPVINGCSQTILQTKVDPANLGKVLATARAISQVASPLAYAIAGPLADHVFEPLLRPGGSLTGSVGRLIGVGPGRGMALMFFLVGLLLVVLALAASHPRLRRVEDLPDLLGLVESEQAPAAKKNLADVGARRSPATEEDSR